MKFNVLGREIEVNWDHVFIVLGVQISLAILFTLIGFLYSFASGYSYGSWEFGDAFVNYAFTQGPILGIISTPLIAFIFLWVAGYFYELKKDVSLCRSLAAASLILGIVLIPITILISFLAIPYVSLLFIISNGFITLVGGLLFTAMSAFILYLWLLIIVKPNMERIKKAAEFAVIFSIAFLIITELILFIIQYQSDTGVYLFTFDPISVVISLANNFMFGLLILYYIYKKKLGQIAYLFAGIYLAPTLVYAIINFITGLLDTGLTNGAIYFNYAIEGIISFVERAFELALLFYIGKISLK